MACFVEKILNKPGFESADNLDEHHSNQRLDFIDLDFDFEGELQSRN